MADGYDDLNPVPLSGLAAQQMTHSQPASNPPPTLPQQVQNFWNYQPPGSQNDPLFQAHTAMQPDVGTVLSLPDGGGASTASIIGPMGATIQEMQQLAEAQRAAAGGMSLQDIYNRYRWFNHPVTGKAMSEIPDYGTDWHQHIDQQISQLPPNSVIEGSLREFYAHPELFEFRYPQIGNMPLRYHNPADQTEYQSLPMGEYGEGAHNPFDPTQQTTRGMYIKHYEPGFTDPGEMKYRKRMNMPVQPDETRATLLHEGTHAVGHREGMPQLGRDLKDYDQRVSEVIARAAEQRKNMQRSKLYQPGQTLPEHLNRQIPYSQQTYNRLGNYTFPHDQPGWPGPWWDRQTPGFKQSWMKQYMETIGSGHLTDPDMNTDILSLIRKMQGQTP